MNIRPANFAVLLVSLSSISAQAAQVYVEPASGSGVSASDLTTATDLVSSSVSDVSSDTVVNQASQAEYVLKPKLIRLGEAYVLSLSKVRDGKVVFSSQLKAAHMDELDKVALRLTGSVILGKRASDDAHVGEITDQEAKEGTQRHATRKQTYLGFGGSSFGNLNSSGIGFSLGAAYAWDLNRARVKLLAEGDMNGSAFFASAGLGGSYFLSLADLAPYLAADFGAGAAKVDGGGAFTGPTTVGFVVGFGAGIELLRTSSVNLDLGFRAAYLLHSNDFGLPQAYSLRLGLYF
jgi:hypothetical protein